MGTPLTKDERTRLRENMTARENYDDHCAMVPRLLDERETLVTETANYMKAITSLITRTEKAEAETVRIREMVGYPETYLPSDSWTTKAAYDKAMADVTRLQQELAHERNEHIKTNMKLERLLNATSFVMKHDRRIWEEFQALFREAPTRHEKGCAIVVTHRANGAQQPCDCGVDSWQERVQAILEGQDVKDNNRISLPPEEALRVFLVNPTSENAFALARILGVKEPA